MNDTSKELDKTKDELDKTKDDDSHDFNIDGKNKDTNDIYDPNGFIIDCFNKYTKTVYDPNGFDINGFYKGTRSKYDSNGFDINGKHKARSFVDQKGKGYVDLPILLSKIYTNNNTVETSSKVSNVKQLKK